MFSQLGSGKVFACLYRCSQISEDCALNTELLTTVNHPKWWGAQLARVSAANPTPTPSPVQAELRVVEGITAVGVLELIVELGRLSLSGARKADLCGTKTSCHDGKVKPSQGFLTYGPQNRAL